MWLVINKVQERQRKKMINLLKEYEEHKHDQFCFGEEHKEDEPVLSKNNEMN